MTIKDYYQVYQMSQYCFTSLLNDTFEKHKLNCHIIKVGPNWLIEAIPKHYHCFISIVMLLKLMLNFWMNLYNNILDVFWEHSTKFEMNLMSTKKSKTFFKHCNYTSTKGFPVR